MRTLLETTIPLDAINAACEIDKNVKTGHIRNIHKWFAPMPLPCWRALLYAALVPYDELSVEQHFQIISSLVSSDQRERQSALVSARQNIQKIWGGNTPAIVDPFCGGGSTIVEAQRLGLQAYASDLNPMPVLITSALTGFIQRFHGKIHSVVDRTNTTAEAIIFAELDYYAARVEQIAREIVGKFYPQIELPDGRKATVLSGVWARTVKSPSPALAGQYVPLVKSFWLSKSAGNMAWIAIEPSPQDYSFVVRKSGAPQLEGTMVAGGARCALSGDPITFNYIREQAKAGQLRLRLLALQCIVDGKRIYLSPDAAYETLGLNAYESSHTDLPSAALGFRIQEYGLTIFEQLFIPRQLRTLDTFADAIRQVVTEIECSGRVEFEKEDTRDLLDGGEGCRAFTDGLAGLLALALGKLVQSNNASVRWYIDARNGTGQPIPAFDRQTIQMSWDFAEVNPFGGSIGSWGNQIASIRRSFSNVSFSAPPANVTRCDVREAAVNLPENILIASDPPYYDNIGYADLSDTFYIWIRKAVRSRFPGVLGTIKTPKTGELIADPARHSSKEDAKKYFQDGFTQSFRAFATKQNPELPFIIIYAFKQQEERNSQVSSTGWEVILQGLYDAGVSIVGTWPIASNRSKRMRAIGSNALASSLALICRYGLQDGQISRGEFIRRLGKELPAAVALLKKSSIAPVDLAQAAIGPGMAIFSRYSSVIGADDTKMSVKSALQDINSALDVYFSDQEAEFDPHTRFAITWFETSGMDVASYGAAETLAKARGVAVQGVKDAGIIESGAGKVRLRRRDELPKDWEPYRDRHITIWECTQHLIRRLLDGSEGEAAQLMAKLGARAEPAKDLAYRLYGICNQKRWADEGYAYNALVASWPRLSEQSRNFNFGSPQTELSF